MNSTIFASGHPSAKGLRFPHSAVTPGSVLWAVADRLRRRSGLVRFAAIVAACGLCCGTVYAQSTNYVNYTSGTYTQNFSALGTTTGSISGTGPWNLDTAFSISDSAGSNVNGWFVNDSNHTLTTGIPSATTGSIYNFTNPNDPGVNALGGTATSSTGAVTVGVVLYNDSANTYGSANISYQGQEWWSYGQQNLDISSQVFSSSPSITAGGFTAGPSGLNYTESPTGSGTATVSGNSTMGPSGSDVTNLSGEITGINWTPGTYLVIDWTTTSVTKLSGLGVTNLSVTPNIGADLTWNGSSGEAWDTSHTYWLNSGSPSTFTSNGTDAVTFGNTGVGAVVIQSGGVNPSSTIVSNTSGTYTFSDNDGTNGIGGSGSLTMDGAGGTLVLNGANSYSGGTFITAGTLNTGTAGDAGLGQAGVGVTLGGGTLQLASGFGDSTRGLTLSATSTIDLGATNQFVTFSGGLTGSLTAGLTLTGTGTVNLSGTFGTALGPLAVTGSGGNLELSPTNSPTIDMVLPTTSAFTGNLTIGGTAVFALLGSATVGTPGEIAGGGKVDIAANNVAMEADHSGSYGPGDVVISNTIVMNTTGLSGPFNTFLGATSGYTLTVNGVTDSYNSETGLGAGNLVIANTNVAGGGGKGEVILDGPLTYHGETIIDTAKTGTAQLGPGVSLPSTTALVFGDGTSGSTPGSLDLNGNSFSIASLSTNLGAADADAGLINSSDTPSTLTIDGSANTTYSGLIGAANATENAIGLTLASANTGSLNLTGVETYTGPTNVNGGLLSVNGTLSASSAVTVGSGGTLGGGIDANQGGTIDGTLHAYMPSATIGNIQGSVTVEAGGTLSPGNSVGTLTVGTLALDSGSMLHYEFNTTTPSNDLTNVTTSGGLSVSGGSFDLVLENTSTPFDKPGTYYLITYTGSLTGSVSNLSVSDPQAGYSYMFSTVSGIEGPLNAVELTISAVPEPSTWAMMLIGASTIGLWSLRRNRNSVRKLAV